jgi:hypothetical protein
MREYLPPYVLRSAPADFNRQVEEVRDQLRQFQANILTIITIMFAVLAAALAIAALR